MTDVTDDEIRELIRKADAKFNASVDRHAVYVREHYEEIQRVRKLCGHANHMRDGDRGTSAFRVCKVCGCKWYDPACVTEPKDEVGLMALLAEKYPPPQSYYEEEDLP